MIHYRDYRVAVKKNSCGGKITWIESELSNTRKQHGCCSNYQNTWKLMYKSQNVECITNMLDKEIMETEVIIVIFMVFAYNYLYVWYYMFDILWYMSFIYYCWNRIKFVYLNHVSEKYWQNVSSKTAARWCSRDWPCKH